MALGHPWLPVSSTDVVLMSALGQLWLKARERGSNERTQNSPGRGHLCQSASVRQRGQGWDQSPRHPVLCEGGQMGLGAWRLTSLCHLDEGLQHGLDLSLHSSDSLPFCHDGVTVYPIKFTVLPLYF